MRAELARQSSLVGTQVEGRRQQRIVASVNRWASGQQRHGESWAAIVLQRAELRVQWRGRRAGQIAIHAISEPGGAVGLAD